jgi:integrase
MCVPGGNEREPNVSVWTFCFCEFCRKIESRRADSNRLPLLQLRVIIQALQELARACKSRISKQVSLLWLATCCTVLRSRWYQSGINSGNSCFAILPIRRTHLKYAQHLTGHASIQLTLDRYSHWMPTMGRHTASAMDEALDEADREGGPNDKKGALER